jgi:hypothetical protein
VTEYNTRPPQYQFLSWHELVKNRMYLDVHALLSKISDFFGVVPPTLTHDPDPEISYHAALIFCNQAGIQLPPRDVEAYIIHPHKHYASLGYVHQEWDTFYKWCLETGWVTLPIKDAQGEQESEIPVNTRGKNGKRREVAVA